MPYLEAIYNDEITGTPNLINVDNITLIRARKKVRTRRGNEYLVYISLLGSPSTIGGYVASDSLIGVNLRANEIPEADHRPSGGG